jgi:hypothetical protein
MVCHVKYTLVTYRKLLYLTTLLHVVHKFKIC